MDTQQEKELEIDLIELLREIKKHLPLIIITTLLFAAVAYAYKFVYLPPTYTYARMVKCPFKTSALRDNNIPDQELLSYVAIFRTDISNGALWKDSGKGRLTSVDLVKEKNVNTKLIQFQFAGTDPAYIKTVSQNYLDSVAKRLNDYLAEISEAEFKTKYYETANKELKDINTALSNKTISPQNVADYLPVLDKRLTAQENNKFFLKAKIIDAPNLEPSRVNDRPFVMKCTFLGLFLSLGYVVCRYMWQQAKQNGII